MWDVILCPVCGEEIHRHRAEPISYRASIPARFEGHASDVLTAMHQQAEATYSEIVRKAENACVEHFHDRHSLRYRLWRRTGWNAFVTFGWRRKNRQPVPDDTNVLVFSGLQDKS